MSEVRKMVSRIATAGAVAAGALVLTVASTGAANAASGGWFKTVGQCNQSGHNIVETSGYTSWTCKQSSTHNPPWHLILS
ncbi:hypothetical protein ACIQZN_05555 [Streptomyces sp. NPDC097595]|uniref:hypothetical protein n=1 Tax=unclassified Streptomyces TaxID=2593676 RepID=UPI002E284AB0|nr:hypothetical protein [Streptomyces sp. NBC_00441]